ncbi:MAG: hypothetical protein CMH54_09190 [Myxococcales bacterium]|nr:hypothetical protein [Myxococcales bacterium]|tara:strand:- start:124 stop:1488 length:1365 start_codon:yes stop_codon:yes gene_type:complete
MSGIHRSPERVAPRSLESLVTNLRLRQSASATGQRRLSQAEILENPGLLKLDLMVHGVRLAPELFKMSKSEEAYRNYFANTRDIEILLSEGTRVTAPVGLSPYLLSEADGSFQLSVEPHLFADERRVDSPLQPIEVGFAEPSSFYTRTTTTGKPLSSVATIRGAYLAVSPLSRCTFVGTDDQCHFCSLSEVEVPGQLTVEDVVEAVGVALETDSIEVVYLSTGYVNRADGGVKDLEPFIRAIKHRYNVLVAVDALPPSENAWIDRTYAMGVDAISYNLEVYDPQDFAEICPGPSRAIGRGRFLEALQYATGVFSAGSVICHLMVGMEPLESTAAGVEELCSMGIVPVLPLFRPFRGLDMRLQPEHAAAVQGRLQIERLASLYGLLYRSVRTHRIPLKFAHHVSVATTPLEARFFTGDEARLKVFLNKLSHSRLGRATRVRLADIRRLLRVREQA